MPTHVKRTAEDKIDHIGSAAKKAKLDGKVSNCLNLNIGRQVFAFSNRKPDVLTGLIQYAHFWYEKQFYL